MSKWEKFRFEVVDGLTDMAIAFECLATRQWNGLPVTFVEEPREQAAAQSCSRADLSSKAILDFLRDNNSKSTLFDKYMVTELQREVKTDE